LTIRQTTDRVLMHCWAGCTAGDICAALGLTPRDLFTDSPPPSSASFRRTRTPFELLESWRQAEIERCAEDLRTRHTMIRIIDQAVRDGVLTEEGAMIWLGYEYHDYNVIEERFWCLLRDEDT